MTKEEIIQELQAISSDLYKTYQKQYKASQWSTHKEHSLVYKSYDKLEKIIANLIQDK